MCAVGEKLIHIPDNCGVVRCFVDETYIFPYPLLIVHRTHDNPDFNSNWEDLKPSWLEENKRRGYCQTSVDHYKATGVVLGTEYWVKAPGVANWCAECNVMQARPCYEFRCASCDNQEYNEELMSIAWQSWRELIGDTSDYDDLDRDCELIGDTSDYDDLDGDCDWDCRSRDSDSTYTPWRGCHMQD